MAKVTLENVTKVYRDEQTATQVKAVDGLSFVCNEGEFVVLLGPSGCGKTSTLRMIAGLEEISAGKISIDSTVVNDLPPRQRNVAMAFENYALYPPLTVFENLVFPLRARGLPESEAEKRVEDVAGILHISDILQRRPAELSGGQQQRVSLGRCIIRDARVYLMDEPLSHIDSELRLRTRGELKRLHERYGHTILYVTHDQSEALALADRVVVMDNGTLQQMDTVENIFERPANLFVADFIGEPPMSFLQGTVSVSDGRLFFNAQDCDLTVPLSEITRRQPGSWQKKKLILGVRPYHIHLGSIEEFATYRARVAVYESVGEEGVVELDVEGCAFTALTDPELSIRSRETLTVSIDWRKAILFDSQTGGMLQV